MWGTLAGMTQALSVFGWSVLAGLAALSVAWVLLARRRGWGRAGAEVGTVAAGLPLLATAAVPMPGPHQPTTLQPGGTLAAVLTGEGTTAEMMHMLGTVLILVPLAALAPLLWRPARSMPRVLLAAAVAGILAEGLQHLLPTGRVSSLDDVVLLMVGAGLGALATRPWWRQNTAPTMPAQTPVYG